MSAEVEFDCDMEGTSPCVNCTWPVHYYLPPYQSADHGRGTWFHVMGKYGEMPKCEKAEGKRT